MKIAMLLRLSNVGELNLKNCLIENPGIGGTHFCQITLASILSQDVSIEMNMFTFENLNLPDGINQIIVDNEQQALNEFMAQNFELLIFVANNPDTAFYESIDRLQIPAVAWVHNFIHYKTIRLLSKTTYIKRAVFVGRQHYDSYIDDPIRNKATYIYNIVPNQQDYCRILTNEKIVTYAGFLGKVKGFHILAKNWKYILKKVPDAQLYILGSGKLYDRTQRYGPYGLADYEYEQYFMKYLLDSDGNQLQSVHFMGTMGEGKDKIYRKTRVGVANPTGKSETFCLSAAEFEAASIPVVTYKGYGLLDTVINQHTGLSSKLGKIQAKQIITLLKDIKLNKYLGENGARFIKHSFSPHIISSQWITLLNAVLNNQEVIVKFQKNNMLDDFKWLKYLNYLVQERIAFCPKVSLNHVRGVIKEFVKKSIGK